MFKLVSDYKPTGDQPKAIEYLSNGYIMNIGKEESIKKEVILMGIFDMTDNFTNKLNLNEFETENLDQYINGVKEHNQPLVMFTNNGKDVIYREEV